MSGPAPSHLDELTETMELLTGCRPVQGRSPTSPSTHTWLIIPGRSRPRILIPALSAGPATLGRTSAALPASRQLTRLLLARTLDGPLSRFCPTMSVPRPDDDDFLSHLAEVLGVSVTVSVTIGARRSNRKPVLEVFDDDGTSLGFAKIALTPLAGRLLETEKAALQRLAPHAFHQLRVPAVHAEGSWRGHPFMVTESLRTRWRRLDDDALIAGLLDLHAIVPPRTLRVRETSHWSDLLAVAAEPPAGTPPALPGVLSAVDARFGDEEVLAGASHGDWSRWNMSAGRERLNVWDWERFDSTGVWGVDAAHLQCFPIIQRSLHRRGDITHDQLTRAVAPTLAQLPVTLPADEVVDIYLAAMITRYATDDPEGEHVGSMGLLGLMTSLLLSRYPAVYGVQP